MLEQLATNPFLFSTLTMNAPQSGLENLTTELRVDISGTDTNPARAEILSVRVVQTLGWNPDQSVYFEAMEGIASLEETDAQTAQLTGVVQGYYRRPVRGREELQGDGDFREAPALPATLDLSFRLSLPAPAFAVPRVSGSLSIRSAAIAQDFGGLQRIDAAVVDGEARMFPRDLPAKDASGQDFMYFLPILPVLVHETNPRILTSPERLLQGAVDLWEHECGIRIISESQFPLIVDSQVTTSLANGSTTMLINRIRQEVPRGGGVPVAFVQPLFARGGGRATDHGPQRAIVVVTEQSEGNNTLLAHELGHVLGGKEAGSPRTATYWVGESNTVMDAPGDVAIAAPAEVRAFGCRNARKFALWKRVS